MVTVLSISRHSPENCPFHGEKLKELGNEVIEKYGTLDKAVEERNRIVEKHGIKEIGRWIVPSEHLIFEVVEAPSLEAYEELLVELQSPILRLSTTQIKLAFNSKEAMRMMVPSADRLSESEKHLLQKIIEYFL